MTVAVAAGVGVRRWRVRAVRGRRLVRGFWGLGSPRITGRSRNGGISRSWRWRLLSSCWWYGCGCASCSSSMGIVLFVDDGGRKEKMMMPGPARHSESRRRRDFRERRESERNR